MRNKIESKKLHPTQSIININFLYYRFLKLQKKITLEIGKGNHGTSD